jgi:hypothetical protein
MTFHHSSTDVRLKKHVSAYMQSSACKGKSRAEISKACQEAAYEEICNAVRFYRTWKNVLRGVNTGIVSDALRFYEKHRNF